MKFYLFNLIILLASTQIRSNNESEQSTITNEVENSVAFINKMDEQCYAYCFNIVQPVLEHTVSIQVKEQQILEKNIILKNLEKQLADLQAKVGIYEETIRNKDLQLTDQLLTSEKYKNETVEKIGVFEETLRKKDLQLLSCENSKNEIVVKFGVCEETIKSKDFQLTQQIIASEKYRNETIDKTNIIASKDEQQSQMKEKLIEYKVKSESCLASSCIGKLNAIYDIKVPGMEAFSVPCDSSLAGSGWTVIQRRKDGSVDFNRNWTDYRQGFGDLQGEFFIGLEKLYLLTRSQPHELYISLMDFSNETRYARYSEFSIGSEEEFYKLKEIGTYSGNAGNSMQPHKNYKFSTPDMDHDTDNENCAKTFNSGWWYYNCYLCNLNGLYKYEDTNKDVNSIEWRGWKKDRPLKFTQMMIKPKSD